MQPDTAFRIPVSYTHLDGQADSAVRNRRVHGIYSLAGRYGDALEAAGGQASAHVCERAGRIRYGTHHSGGAGGQVHGPVSYTHL